jgi:hypothetical protein
MTRRFHKTHTLLDIFSSELPKQNRGAQNISLNEYFSKRFNYIEFIVLVGPAVPTDSLSVTNGFALLLERRGPRTSYRLSLTQLLP